MKRALALLLLGISGCSVVEITSVGQEARVETHFGLTHLHMHPEQAPVVAKIRSFGFVETPIGATLGYSDQTIVAVPPSCHAVFLIENQEQFEQIKSLVGGKNLCPVIVEREDIQ